MKLKNLILEVSRNCNFNCSMCGYSGHPMNSEWNMRWSVIVAATEFIQAETIRLNGRGESTVHPLFNTILDFVSNYSGSQLELFTNGSYNETTSRKLIENNVRLYISMDSPDYHELKAIRKGVNYMGLMDNLTDLCIAINNDEIVRPYLVMTVQNANIHRIYDMAICAYRRGMNLIYNVIHGATERINLKHVATYRKQFKMAAELFASMPPYDLQIPSQVQGIDTNIEDTKKTNNSEKGHCPAVIDELTIKYNGDILPCNMFCPETLGSIFELENLKNFTDQDSHWFCKSCASMSGGF